MGEQAGEPAALVEGIEPQADAAGPQLPVLDLQAQAPDRALGLLCMDHGVEGCGEDPGDPGSGALDRGGLHVRRLPLLIEHADAHSPGGGTVGEVGVICTLTGSHGPGPPGLGRRGRRLRQLLKGSSQGIHRPLQQAARSPRRPSPLMATDDLCLLCPPNGDQMRREPLGARLWRRTALCLSPSRTDSLQMDDAPPPSSRCRKLQRREPSSRRRCPRCRGDDYSTPRT